jgi:hypothetical protein
MKSLRAPAENVDEQIEAGEVGPMRRPILVIFGVVLAAVGGVIAYRAYYLDPRAAIVITNTDVREVPDYFRVVGGIALLIVGAAIAYTAALRRK